MITFVVVVVVNWLLFVLSNYTKFLYSSSTKPKVNPYMYVLLVEIIFFAFILMKVLLNLRSMEQTAQIISEGNVEYQMDTSKLLSPFKEHGDTLDRINDSVEQAVAEQTKSERM